MSNLLLHTPGPWELHLTDDCSEVESAGKRIVSIDTGMDPELEANALLIAAAPDLLAACETLQKAALAARNYLVNAPELRFTNENQLPAESLYFAIKDALSAIAKARGENK